MAVQFWPSGGSKKVLFRGPVGEKKVAMNENCCCGNPYNCTTCPTAAEITISGAANQDGCANCGNYNGTFNVPFSTSFNMPPNPSGSFGYCSGTESFSLPGCAGPEIVVSWTVICNDDPESDTPHSVFVGISEGAPGNYASGFYKPFATGEDITDFILDHTFGEGDPQIPCFFNDDYTLVIVTVSITLVF